MTAPGDDLKAAIDAFIAEARAVAMDRIFALVGGKVADLRRATGGEMVGPCPACRAGTDRFTINFGKGVWHCRQCDGGKGGDGLALVAQVHGFNLRSKSGLLGACEEILGRSAPDGSERESEAERAERQKRLDARQADNAKSRKQQNDFAERERARAISQGRGFYFNAASGAGSPVEAYLKARLAVDALPAGLWANLRYAANHSFYHGRDDRGHGIEIHCGPAMIAPLIDPVGNFARMGEVTGAHQTWIDLDQQPKFRPCLFDDKGEALQTKKMRGHFKGSIIPLLGDLSARRWLCGEGIETTGWLAAQEGWRDDTFYFAAGSLGNISGPADPDSSFYHPNLTKPDSAGRARRVKVGGPVPKPGSEGDCFQVPAHVTDLVIGADGDCEKVRTLSDMARAEARLARPGLTVSIWWPPEGMDWADLSRGAK